MINIFDGAKKRQHRFVLWSQVPEVVRMYVCMCKTVLQVCNCLRGRAVEMLTSLYLTSSCWNVDKSVVVDQQKSNMMLVVRATVSKITSSTISFFFSSKSPRRLYAELITHSHHFHVTVTRLQWNTVTNTLHAKVEVCYGAPNEPIPSVAKTIFFY